MARGGPRATNRRRRDDLPAPYRTVIIDPVLALGENIAPALLRRWQEIGIAVVARVEDGPEYPPDIVYLSTGPGRVDVRLLAQEMTSLRIKYQEALPLVFYIRNSRGKDPGFELVNTYIKTNEIAGVINGIRLLSHSLENLENIIDVTGTLGHANYHHVPNEDYLDFSDVVTDDLEVEANRLGFSFDDALEILRSAKVAQRTKIPKTEPENRHESRDPDYDESKNLVYSGEMKEVTEFSVAARTLSNRELEEFVNKGEVAKAELAARRVVDRATGTPRVQANTSETSSPVQSSETIAEETKTPVTSRLHWRTDRNLNENPAQFAARAYASEIQDGTFDRSLIRRDDKTLYQRLYRDKAWSEFEALTAASALTKSQRRSALQIEAMEAAGLEPEAAQRAAAAIKSLRNET
jgi:hypothetical protein